MLPRLWHNCHFHTLLMAFYVAIKLFKIAELYTSRKAYIYKLQHANSVIGIFPREISLCTENLNTYSFNNKTLEIIKCLSNNILVMLWYIVNLVKYIY